MSVNGVNGGLTKEQIDALKKFSSNLRGTWTWKAKRYIFPVCVMRQLSGQTSFR